MSELKRHNFAAEYTLTRAEWHACAGKLNVMTSSYYAGILIGQITVRTFCLSSPNFDQTFLNIFWHHHSFFYVILGEVGGVMFSLWLSFLDSLYCIGSYADFWKRGCEFKEFYNGGANLKKILIGRGLLQKHFCKTFFKISAVTQI